MLEVKADPLEASFEALRFGLPSDGPARAVKPAPAVATPEPAPVQPASQS